MAEEVKPSKYDDVPMVLKTDHDGSEFQFQHYGEICNWARTETKFWNKMEAKLSPIGQLGKSIAEQHAKIFEAIEKHAGQIVFNIDSVSGQSLKAIKKEIGKLLLEVESGQFLLSRNTDVQTAFRESDPRIAFSILAWKLPSEFNYGNSNNSHALKIARAMTEVRFRSPVDENRVNLHERKLNELENRWESSHRQIISQQNIAAQEEEKNRRGLVRKAARLIAQHRREFNSHKERMETIEATFREELSLRAPVTYWEKKAEGHKEGSRIALGGFCALSISAVFLFFYFGPNFLSTVKTVLGAKEGGAISLSILIAFPTVLVLWVLRHISRIYITNQKLAEDAAFRAIQTETYLALMADDGSEVSEDDRFLILNALFRPIDSAGSDDDTLPPNLLEILKRRSS